MKSWRCSVDEQALEGLFAGLPLGTLMLVIAVTVLMLTKGANRLIHGAAGPALRSYVERSLKNSRLEALDPIQLHCPPTAVYYRPEIFELFECRLPAVC